MGLQRLQPQFDQRRPGDRDTDHIGRGGRNLHAEDEAGERGEQQRRPQQAAGSGENERGDLDPQPGDRQNPDDQRGAQDDRRDHRDLPPGGQEGGFETRPGAPPVEAEIPVQAQHRGPDQGRHAGGVLRGQFGDEHAPQQHREGHHEKGGRDGDVAGGRLVLAGDRAQVEPGGIGVDADPDREEIEDRGQQRGGHDPGIGNAGQFDHDKRPCAHQRRHDLTARRGDRFGRRGQSLGIAQPGHGGQRDRAGRGDIRRGRTGDRSEQGRRNDRDLGRPALQATGGRGGDIHEALSRLARVQERAEDDEDGHDADRDTGQAAPQSPFRDRHGAEKTL